LRGLYDQIFRQLEMHNRLSWYIEIPVPRQSRDGSSRATACQAAYCESYATAGQATHQHAKARTSANQGRRASAFALLGARQVSRRQLILRSVHSH
jgi:hypothetical protein